MTQLLVSVRSVEEARDALAGGANLIDVKEPSRGSLGPADPAVWREVASVVAGRAPVSVALGELRDGPDVSLVPGDVGIGFAKIGLAGCAANADWPIRWRDAVASLPASVRPVAASYADWRGAEAPPPPEVLETGARLGCAAWLIDTYHKSTGDLFTHATAADLSEWITTARRHGMLAILAGSLARASVPLATNFTPDYLAVRSAVCNHGREGKLDAGLVQQLHDALSSGPQRALDASSPTSREA